jgi:hypothetical protein
MFPLTRASIGGSTHSVLSPQPPGCSHFERIKQQSDTYALHKVVFGERMQLQLQLQLKYALHVLIGFKSQTQPKYPLRCCQKHLFWFGITFCRGKKPKQNITIKVNKPLI